MTLRKKHLKIGALILLGICVLGGIALGVYFLFFHKEKSEPEPPYTTLIASTLRADTLSDITVTDNGSGDCYTLRTAPPALPCWRACRRFTSTGKTAIRIRTAHHLIP